MMGLLPAALAVALLIDRLLGEPPACLHPVVAMGRYLHRLGPVLTRCAPAWAFTGGALAWLAGAAAVAALAWWVQRALVLHFDAWAAALLLGLALKPLLAWRMLAGEVRAVEDALAQSLDDGRARLSHLVSRDVAQLDEHAVRESAIESLAENLCDSVVAPLFWFALAGLPGAALYRFANTADAMWGYRGLRGGHDWTWAGKWAARADDVLSWLPARLTALTLGAGWAMRWHVLACEAARTPSPNGGWTMGAMALRLGVTLGKPGVYRLHATARAPGAADTARALHVAGQGVLLAAAGCMAMQFALALGGLHA